MLPVHRNLPTPYSFHDVDSVFYSLWNEFDDIFGDSRYVDKNKDLVYEIEVPGFNKDNLSVDIADGILTVQGKREVGEKYAGQKEVFKRLSIGEAKDADAKITDGILTITLKRPEKKSTKVNLM